MALITCRDLCLGYDGREILHGLSFEVDPGDYLCIVGENGAGKSTLMRTLLGLQRPLSGQILTGDGLRPCEIGYLPQQTPVQKDFPASVWEVVLSGFEGSRGWRPFYTRAEKSRAMENIRAMGIESLTRRCYRELSGGQQQRVLLSRALCATGKLLFLDEPVAGLDPIAAAEMYEQIESLNRQKGITVIMISHDVGAALRYASHVLHVGERVFFGTKEAYRGSAVGSAFAKGGEDK